MRGMSDGSRETCDSSESGSATPPIAYPRFASAYNWLMARSVIQLGLDPLRRAVVGQASGLVLEVGAGGGQNFPFYDPAQVTRVVAAEPDATMLAVARRHIALAPVPITLTRAAVEALPFSDATFDSVVSAFVWCSVADPAQGLREVWRVLKPGGRLSLLEHVRASGALVAGLQDALVPLTTRFMGNDHWNRDTVQNVRNAGFAISQLQQVSGGLSPLLRLVALRSAAPASENAPGGPASEDAPPEHRVTFSCVVAHP